MTSSPDLFENIPEPEAGKPRDIVEAVQLLDELIKTNEEALLRDAELHPESSTNHLDIEEIASDISDIPLHGVSPQVLDLFDGVSPEDDFDGGIDQNGLDELPEKLDLNTLKAELLSDLGALIDVGLRRATDSARERLSQEFNQELTGSGDPPLAAGATADDHEEAGGGISLWQAVGDILSRYGLADRNSSAFYRELEAELQAILDEGLEQIRARLEAVLQARVSARAESQLEAQSAPRRHQHLRGLESPGGNEDNSPGDFP